MAVMAARYYKNFFSGNDVKEQAISNFVQLSDTDLADERFKENVGLDQSEYERLRRLIGRTPNKVELAIVGALWSEHCSYKSTRAHLSNLPTTGPHVVVGPGENAGAIDVGDNSCVSIQSRKS